MTILLYVTACHSLHIAVDKLYKSFTKLVELGEFAFAVFQSRQIQSRQMNT